MYYDYSTLTDIASSLYSGDWRAEDRDQMIDEYDLTEEQADQICEKLAEYAEKDAEEDED